MCAFSRDRRTPLPGAVGDLHRLDAADMGDGEATRRVDPAPLAHLIGTFLRLVDGSSQEAARAIAEDERDGPIHLVHLVAACDLVARSHPGGRLGPGRRIWGWHPAVGGLLDALHEGGLAAATQAARQLDPEARYGVLITLPEYVCAPITALGLTLADDDFV